MKLLLLLLRFWWNRDSESAVCVCINAAEAMTITDLRQTTEYFIEVHRFAIKNN